MLRILIVDRDLDTREAITQVFEVEGWWSDAVAGPDEALALLERNGAYDAVLSESVFYTFDLPHSFSKVHRLIRSGGLFAFTEMLWTADAKHDVVALLHDQTKEIFGIPMAPRQVVTLADWASALRQAGFSEVITRRIDPALDAERHARRARLALGLLTRPRLLPLFLTYRVGRRIERAPAGWLESWMGVWRRG